MGRDCDVVTGTLPFTVVLADLDADDDLDLAVTLTGSESVAVFLNDGAGTFAEPSILPVGDGAYSAAASDLDGDGDTDLAVANLVSILGPAVSVLGNEGDATFAPAVNFALGGVAIFVTAGDLDGDADAVNWPVGWGPESVALGGLDAFGPGASRTGHETRSCRDQTCGVALHRAGGPRAGDELPDAGDGVHGRGCAACRG